MAGDGDGNQMYHGYTSSNFHYRMVGLRLDISCFFRLLLFFFEERLEQHFVANARGKYFVAKVFLTTCSISELAKAFCSNAILEQCSLLSG